MLNPAPLESIVKVKPSEQTPVHLQRQIREFVWRETRGTVQTGPFAGMRVPMMMDSNLGTKCLGSYEAELHGPLEREIARLNTLKSPLIINLGCSQGYYAVGLALRVPGATVIGVDIKPERFGVLHGWARINGVSVTTVAADKFTLGESDFILSDCEGAEAEYLDPERYPFLFKTPMLVETHADTDEILCRRFHATHSIARALSEQWREPNSYPCLLGLHSHHKWLAVSENRPATHSYLYLVPKEPTS